MESDALGQLYEACHRELYLYLFSLCGSRERTEDLLQETFLKALVSLPEGHAAPRAWLFLVSRHLWVSSLRRSGRETLLETEPPVEETAELAERLIADESRRTLYRAIARLEPRRREVIELHYFSGLSLKEIAGVMRLTPENVRVLACRARKDLRREMEEDGYDLS